MLELPDSCILAMADMSGTPYAITALILCGILMLRFLRPAKSKSRTWLPLAALLAGPMIAIAYFAADVFIVSRNYFTTNDYIQSLIPILIIGLAGGAIGSFSFWVGEKLMPKPSIDASKKKNLDSSE